MSSSILDTKLASLPLGQTANSPARKANILLNNNDIFTILDIRYCNFWIKPWAQETGGFKWRLRVSSLEPCDKCVPPSALTPPTLLPIFGWFMPYKPAEYLPQQSELVLREKCFLFIRNLFNINSGIYKFSESKQQIYTGGEMSYFLWK